MNFYYVEIRHAEAVESKWLHVVTHLNTAQMYKITQAFVCYKYIVTIRPCEYRTTCEYLGYDPFTGLDKFLEKCEAVKLYKRVTNYKEVPHVVFNSYDFSKWYDLVEINNLSNRYSRSFIDFQSKNPLMEIKQSELLEWLHANTGTTWKISCIGHYYPMDSHTTIIGVKITDSKELVLEKQYSDFEAVTEFQII